MSPVLPEIKRILLDLETEVDKFKGERDDATIVHHLKKLVETGREEIEPSNFGTAIAYLEVPDGLG